MNTDTSALPSHNFDISVSRKLTKLTPLKKDDLSALSHLPSKPLAVAKGEILVEVPTTTPKLYAVTSGWLYAHSGKSGTDQQIYDIYQAGDFIGFETLSGLQNLVSVSALTPAHLAEIPPQAMSEMMAQNSEIARHLHAVNTLGQITLMDRMQTIARKKPKARVAHLLLEIANRERVTSLYHDGESGNSLTFNLPLVQNLLADCIGLTAVHISRTLTWMTQQNLIERPARTLITLKDEAALVALAQYQNRYIPVEEL